ncbi:MAG: YabP/YqfC family sporulation protein [Clostridia bacterium]|nr:YabP/YqfC family sporulation protein [Clostridia bacterium]
MPKALTNKIKKLNMEDRGDYLLPHIIFNSCREVLVEGSKGVLEYNTKRVRLNAGRYILKFCGDGLCLRALTADEIIIMGDIVSFEFCSV